MKKLILASSRAKATQEHADNISVQTSILTVPFDAGDVLEIEEIETEVD